MKTPRKTAKQYINELKLNSVSVDKSPLRIVDDFGPYTAVLTNTVKEADEMANSELYKNASVDTQRYMDEQFLKRAKKRFSNSQQSAVSDIQKLVSESKLISAKAKEAINTFNSEVQNG